MTPRRRNKLIWASINRAATRIEAGALVLVSNLRRMSASAGSITRSPHRRIWTSCKPSASAAAAISSGVAAALDRSPHARSWESPARSSIGPRGNRLMGTSDIVSTPPGRSTLRASAKNRLRERKWNAASTLMTPSTLSFASGIRTASPTMGVAPASSRAALPSRSWASVMFSAINRSGRATRAMTGSWTPRPGPTSRTTPPVGSSSASVSTSRRTAIGASSSVPLPCHSPRFSQPGARARKKSRPRLS